MLLQAEKVNNSINIEWEIRDVCSHVGTERMWTLNEPLQMDRTVNMFTCTLITCTWVLALITSPWSLMWLHCQSMPAFCASARVVMVAFSIYLQWLFALCNFRKRYLLQHIHGSPVMFTHTELYFGFFISLLVEESVNEKWNSTKRKCSSVKFHQTRTMHQKIQTGITNQQLPSVQCWSKAACMQ